MSLDSDVAAHHHTEPAAEEHLAVEIRFVGPLAVAAKRRDVDVEASDLPAPRPGRRDSDQDRESCHTERSYSSHRSPLRTGYGPPLNSTKFDGGPNEQRPCQGSPRRTRGPRYLP